VVFNLSKDFHETAAVGTLGAHDYETFALHSYSDTWKDIIIQKKKRSIIKLETYQSQHIVHDGDHKSEHDIAA